MALPSLSRPVSGSARTAGSALVSRSEPTTDSLTGSSAKPDYSKTLLELPYAHDLKLTAFLAALKRNVPPISVDQYY